MLSPKDMSEIFGRNHRIISGYIDGLDHAASVIQPPNGGNCINWVLGHIIVSRNNILTACAAEPVWDADKIARYGHGSDPVLGGDNELPFTELLSDFDKSQRRLDAMCAQLTASELEAPYGEDSTAGDRATFYSWHESMHTGQFEYLQQLVGD